MRACACVFVCVRVRPCVSACHFRTCYVRACSRQIRPQHRGYECAAEGCDQIGGIGAEFFNLNGVARRVEALGSAAGRWSLNILYFNTAFSKSDRSTKPSRSRSQYLVQRGALRCNAVRCGAIDVVIPKYWHEGIMRRAKTKAVESLLQLVDTQHAVVVVIHDAELLGSEEGRKCWIVGTVLDDVTCLDRSG